MSAQQIFTATAECYCKVLSFYQHICIGKRVFPTGRALVSINTHVGLLSSYGIEICFYFSPLHTDGFVAQLVRVSHLYREVTGSNPVEVLTFQASIRNCLNCVHNCEDHSLLDFKSAVQYTKYFIYHFTFIQIVLPLLLCE